MALRATAALVALLAVMATRLVRRLRELRLTEDQVALAIERVTPGGLQNRLINALQLARNGGHAPEELVRAYDTLTLEWLAGHDQPQRCAVVAGLIRRAYEAGKAGG